MFVPLRPDAGDRRAAEWIGNEAALFSALSSGSRTPQDIVRGYRGSFNATYSAVDADPYFGAVVGASGVAALSRVSFGRPAVSEPGTRDFTVAAAWRCDNKRSGYGIVSKWNVGSNPASCDWSLGTNGAGLGSPMTFAICVGATSGDIKNCNITPATADLYTNGRHYISVGRRRGASMWLDVFCVETGKWLHGTATGSASAINANSARAVDLGEIDLGAAYSADVSYAWVAMDLAKWSDEQVDGLARDPMSVFERRRRFFAVTAGGGGTTVDPAAGSLAYTGRIPDVLRAVVLSATTGHLAYTGRVATVARATNLTPAAGHLAYTGRVATVLLDRVVTPAGGSMTYTGRVPGLLRGTVISAGTGHLDYGGYAPGIVSAVVLTPAVGHLAYTGRQPSVIAGTIVSAATGHLAYSGNTPGLTRDVVLTPAAGGLAYAGGQPVVTLDRVVVPTAGELVYAGHIPGISSAIALSPDTAHLLFTGRVPSVLQATGDQDITPATAHLLYTGRVPSVATNLFVDGNDRVFYLLPRATSWALSARPTTWTLSARRTDWVLGRR